MEGVTATHTHLGDGTDCVPALGQDVRVGVVEQADEPRQQSADVGAVVQASTGKVGIEDGDGSLPQAGVICGARGLQQVLNDDPLAHLILY